MSLHLFALGNRYPPNKNRVSLRYDYCQYGHEGSIDRDHILLKCTYRCLGDMCGGPWLSGTASESAAAGSLWM